MQQLNQIKIGCLLLFCGLIVNTGISQVEAVIKGKVMNENGAPIKNASVKLGNSDSRTNSSGVFVTKTTEFPAKLSITHQLYAEHLEMIALPERWRDTIRVFVVMTGKEKQLDEVTVSSQKIFWVYTQKQANVLDFILQPDAGIILCCSDKNNYFLRRLDPQGEKINETRIRNHPRNLYRDCMQAIHIVYPDSIYETAMINNSIGIFKPKPAARVYNLLQSCVYIDNNHLVTYKYFNNDQGIEYASINLQTNVSRVLYVGENRQHNRGLRDFANANNVSDEQLFHTTDKDLIRITRSKWAKRKLYEQVLTRPVYIPLIEVNDSLIIFDHLNDSATVFTKSGMLIRSFPIAYHHFDGWKVELITNLEKTEIYARYELDGGLTVLRKINPTNGKVENTIRLEKHVFPEHLQIQGDFIYYIYKDYLDQSMHYIFKQYLE